MNPERYRSLKQLFLLLFPATVVGLHNIPDRGAAIIAFNHHSPLDGVYAWASSRRHIFFLVIAKVFLRPIVGWCLNRSGQIAVDQDDRFSRGIPCSGAMALRAGEEILELGGLVGIAPEGFCGEEGQLNPLELGVVRLALATGTPVIPLGIQRSHRVMADLKDWPRPFRRVKLVYGEPIDVSGRTNSQADRRWLRAVLAQRLAELSNQRPPEEASASLAATRK